MVDESRTLLLRKRSVCICFDLSLGLLARLGQRRVWVAQFLDFLAAPTRGYVVGNLGPHLRVVSQAAQWDYRLHRITVETVEHLLKSEIGHGKAPSSFEFQLSVNRNKHF